MTYPVRVTSIAEIAAPLAYARLATPWLAARFVDEALLAVLDDLESHPPRPTPIAEADKHGRWLFYADPGARRIHWELTAPVYAAGTLDVHGDSTLCQLWLAVHAAPDGWSAQRVRTLARRVVRQLRDRLETGRPRRAHVCAGNYLSWRRTG